MSGIRWNDVVDNLRPQVGDRPGELRDIVVMDSTIHDWECVYRLVRQGYQHRFTLPEFVPPESAADLFRTEDVPPLLVKVGGVEVFCWFYLEDQIELSFDPREVAGEDDLVALVELLAGLGRCTEKRVVLIYEGAPDWVILEYRPESGLVQRPVKS